MGERDQWVVIGISGVTCGGKTTLANRLKDSLTPVYVFHQDKYFYPDDSPNHIKCENMEHNNYDILSALDMETMYSDIMKTMQGTDMSHASNFDTKDKFAADGKKFLVIEGFTALNYTPIMELCDYRYYFTLEYGECAARRCLRVYCPPDVPGYFEHAVWPAHLRYRAEMESDSRVKILDGKERNCLEIVMADVREHCAR